MAVHFSEHFHLGKSQADLPFVNIFVDTDVPLFVDPYAFNLDEPFHGTAFANG